MPLGQSRKLSFARFIFWTRQPYPAQPASQDGRTTLSSARDAARPHDPIALNWLHVRGSLMMRRFRCQRQSSALVRKHSRRRDATGLRRNAGRRWWFANGQQRGMRKPGPVWSVRPVPFFSLCGTINPLRIGNTSGKSFDCELRNARQADSARCTSMCSLKSHNHPLGDGGPSGSSRRTD